MSSLSNWSSDLIGSNLGKLGSRAAFWRALDSCYGQSERKYQVRRCETVSAVKGVGCLGWLKQLYKIKLSGQRFHNQPHNFGWDLPNWDGRRVTLRGSQRNEGTSKPERPAGKRISWITRAFYINNHDFAVEASFVDCHQLKQAVEWNCGNPSVVDLILCYRRIQFDHESVISHKSWKQNAKLKKQDNWCSEFQIIDVRPIKDCNCWKKNP